MHSFVSIKSKFLCFCARRVALVLVSSHFIVLSKLFTAGYLFGVASISRLRAENYMADWNFSETLYLNTNPTSGANVAGDVLNFPVLVRLSQTTFWPAGAKSDGGDIRFSKVDGTRLYYERERWDNISKVAEFWVLVDTVWGHASLAHPSDSTGIKIWWGNTTAVDSSKPQMVFDTANGFRGVWHFSPADPFGDATINNRDGMNNGSTETAGIIGAGRNFSGSGQYISIGAVGIAGSAPRTIAGWVRGSTTGSAKTALGFSPNMPTGEYFFDIRSEGANKYMLYFGNSIGSTVPTNDNVWHYLVATYDGTNCKLYIDGDSVGLGGGPVATQDNFQIGRNQYNSLYWTGVMDEISVAKVARNNDWIKLAYQNQKPNQTLVQYPQENYAEWPYSKNIYLNTTNSGANIPNNVHNFPVLIRLNPSTFNGFPNTLAGGADIRFSKPNGAQLAYEIERWVDGGADQDTAEIWVKVDTVYGNNNTQYFRMHWGKAGVSSRSNGAAVFGPHNGYIGVWHLGEEMADTGNMAVYKDAAGMRHGDDFVSSTSRLGVIGNGKHFNGITDYIRMDSAAAPNRGTVEFWYRPDSLTNQGIVGDHQYFRVRLAATSKMHNILFTDYGMSIGSKTSFSMGNWYHASATYDSGGTFRLYINGVLDTLFSAGYMVPAAFRFTLGRSINEYLKGSLDEVRQSNTVRSADWVKLCFENQRPEDNLTKPSVRYWDNGGGDRRWSTAANWNPDGVPAAGDSVVFNAGSAACTLNVSDTVGAICFTSGYSGVFDFKSNTLSVNKTADLRSAGAFLGNGTLQFIGATPQVFIPKPNAVFHGTIKQNGSGGTTVSVHGFKAAQLSISSGMFHLGTGLKDSVGYFSASGTGGLNFGAFCTLQVGAAVIDFNSLVILEAGNGVLQFVNGITKTFMPKIGAMHPHIEYTLNDSVYLAGSLRALSYTQTNGKFTLGANIDSIAGNFFITNGGLSRIYGLDGRKIKVMGNASLSGLNSGSLLNLNPAVKCTMNVAGTFNADYARIKNIYALGTPLSATVNCINEGGNVGVNFASGTLAYLAGGNMGSGKLVDAAISKGADSVLMLQFKLKAIGETMYLDTVRVKNARGPLHKLPSAPSMRLYCDVDRSGTLSAGDRQVSDLKAANPADSILAFSKSGYPHMDSIPAGDSLTYLVVYAFHPGSLLTPLDTFMVDLMPADIRGRGKNSQNVVLATGTHFMGLKRWGKGGAPVILNPDPDTTHYTNALVQWQNPPGMNPSIDSVYVHLDTITGAWGWLHAATRDTLTNWAEITLPPREGVYRCMLSTSWDSLGAYPGNVDIHTLVFDIQPPVVHNPNPDTTRTGSKWISWTLPPGMTPADSVYVWVDEAGMYKVKAKLPYNSSGTLLDVKYMGERSNLYKVSTSWDSTGAIAWDNVVVKTLVYDIQPPVITTSFDSTQSLTPMITWTAPAGMTPADSFFVHVDTITGVSWKYHQTKDYLATSATLDFAAYGLYKYMVSTSWDSAGLMDIANAALDTIRVRDWTPPSVTLSSAAPALVNGMFTVNIQFSEAVSGFDITDISVTNGTPSGLSVVTANQEWTVNITPATDGLVTVDIGAAVALDIASNPNTAATQLSRAADLTPPSVSITGAPAYKNNTTPFNVTVTFSESVSGFEAGDISVTNGSATNLSGTGASYTAEITPSGTGNILIDINAGVAFDAASNGNQAASQVSVTYDDVSPSVSISSTEPDPTNSSPFSVTITFSESVSNFVFTDIFVTNGSASNLNSTNGGITWTVDITPLSDGLVTVDVGAGVAEDAAGNGNTAAAAQLSRTYDGTAPAVSVTPSGTLTNTSPITFTLTFSENVSGLSTAGITVTNGSKGSLNGGPAVYTVPVTPATDGAVTCQVSAGAAQDGASNGNTISNNASVTYDGTAPVFTSTAPSSSSFINNTKVSYTLSENLASGTITWTRTGGTVDGSSPHEQALAGAELAVGAHNNITLTNNPTLVEGAVYTVSFDGRDAAGNSATTVSNTNITFDASSPSVTLSSAAPALVNGMFTVNIQFSEAVSGFDITDISVTNGTPSGLSVVTANQEWTVNITPATDGLVTVDIGAAVALDIASNPNTAATQLSRTADLTPPSVSLFSAEPDPTKSVSFSVTITFSESVTGFALGDISVTNGTAGNLSGTGASYIADITPATDGPVTVDIGAGVAVDAAGNGNTAAASSLSRTHDATLPVVNAGADLVKNALFNLAGSSSDATSGVAGNAWSKVSGPGTVSFGDPSSLTSTCSMDADGVYVLRLTVTDNAGNQNTDDVQVTWDQTGPTVSLNSAAPDPTNSSPFSVTFTFSESVTGFAVGDISVTNGSAGNFSGAGVSYTADITPSGEGLVSVGVNAGVCTDNAGNANTAATPLTRTYDITQPSVNISSAAPDPTNTSPIPVTITFSEAVSGFAVGDISVTNGSAGNFSGAGAGYTADITPSGQGLVTVDIGAGVCTDLAGNANTAAAQLGRTYDTVQPSVSISSSSPDPTNTSPIPITITFSEAVSGLTVGEISVTNGTASNLNTTNGGVTWTADITPSGDGLVTVDVGAGVAQDAAGNSNTAASQLSRMFDTGPPSVNITSAAPNPTNTSPIPVTITFSESVTGFALGDISVTNGSAGNLITSNDIVFTADITPAGQGLVIVDIAAGVAQDGAANGNLAAASQLSRTFDSVQPSVSISSSAPNPTNTSPIPVTITFSESVTGFALGDISVTNGIAGNFSGAGASYTADITPSGQGLVTVDISAGVANDAAGNTNTAAAQFSRIFDCTAPVVTVTRKKTNDQTPPLSGTVNDNTAAISITVNGQNNQATNNGDGTWTLADNVLTTLSEGAYNVAVRATDAASNVGSDATTNELIIDLTPPASTPATAGMFRAATWPGAVGGTAADALAGVDSVYVAIQNGAGNYWNGSAWGTGPFWNVAAGKTSWSYALYAVNLSDGNYTVLSKASDSAGNVQSSFGVSSFVYDNTAPRGLDSLALVSFTATTATLSWKSVLDERFHRYEIWYGLSTTDVLGRTAGARRWTPADDAALTVAATRSTTIRGLTENVYTLKIWACDSAGNEATIPHIIRKIDVSPPDNDLVLKAEPLDTTAVRLTWSPSLIDSSDADSVGIWYKTTGYPTGAGNGTLGVKLRRSDSVAVVSGLLTGTLYYFIIAVRDASGNWSVIGPAARDTASTIDNIPPVNVTAFKAVRGGGNIVVLSWVPSSSSSADSVIVVYRTHNTYALNPTQGTLIGAYAAARTSDTIIGLAEKRTYYFSAFVKSRYGLWSPASVAASDSVYLPDITPPDNRLQVSLTAMLDTAIVVNINTASVVATDVKHVRLYYSFGRAVDTSAQSSAVIAMTLLPFADTTVRIGARRLRGWWHVAALLEDTTGLRSALVCDSIRIYNNKPRLTLPDSVVVFEDEQWRYALMASDADGDSLQFGLVDPPASITFDSANGAFSWRPSNSDVGRYRLAVWVADARADTVSGVLNLIVRNVNDAPVFDGIAYADTAFEDSGWTCRIFVHDIDTGDSLVAIWVKPIRWITNTTITGPVNAGDSMSSLVISGWPRRGDSGWHCFELKIADRAGAFITIIDSVYVMHINRPPQVSILSRIPQMGSVQYTVIGKDDFDTVITYYAQMKSLTDNKFSINKSATGSVFNGVTFSFFPLSDGQYVTSFYARDSENLTGPFAILDTLVIANATTRLIAYAESSWQMISIPAIAYNAASVKKNAYFLRWDELCPEDKVFKYYKNADAIATTTAGAAYWRQGKDSVVVRLEQKDLLDTDATISLVKAKYGWNQIASPYPYPVVWPSNEVLWRWNAKTRDFEQQRESILYPWEGYFLLTDSSRSLKISNKPVFTASGQAKRLHVHYKSQNEWQVQLRLFTADGAMDADNFLGFSPEAHNARDIFDRPEPPRMPGQQYLFFAHPEWNYSVEEFASDVRRKFEELNVFCVGITPSAKSVAIAGIEFSGVQWLKDVYLFAVSGDSIRQVEESNKMPVAFSDKEVMYTTVFATAEKDFIAKFPRNFEMKHPYPNPFRKYVALRYTLPYRFESNGWFIRESYMVNINIYDGRGRLVRSLINRRQQPGHYHVLWDAKGNTGRFVGVGHYFVTIMAGNYIATKHIVLMK